VEFGTLGLLLFLNFLSTVIKTGTRENVKFSQQRQKGEKTRGKK